VKRRAPVLVLGVVLITVAIGTAAWKLFQATVYEPPAEPAPAGVTVVPSAPPAAAPAPVPAAEEVEVVEVTGRVEKSTPGGEWRRMAQGEKLRIDDVVRTSRSGRAELAIGAAARLTVAEATELDVREVTAAVHRFKLTKGRIAARYQKDGARVLRIEGADGNTAAVAESASFSVLASGASLAVATETGTVQLRSAGGEVKVEAGRQAVATAGQAPSAPVAIPVELLLKVADASRVGSGDLCAAVEGRAAPGTEVLVDGEAVRVEIDGRFSTRVPRRGRKSVVVLTRAVDGRTAEEKVPCRPAPQERLIDFNVRWKNDSEL
jgi:hypothetical protein